MSKSDIQAWAQESRLLADDNAELGEAFQWDTIETSWDEEFIPYAQGMLLTSSTKRRSDFLKERMIPLALRADLDKAQTLDLFQLLVLTYPRYIDVVSRDAVVQVLEVLIRRDATRAKENGGEVEAAGAFGVQLHVLKWLAGEVSRVCKRGVAGSNAPANQFVLLQWSAALYTLALDLDESFVESASWPVLTQAIAMIMDAVLDTTSPIRPSVRTGAVARARRMVRSKPSVINNLATTLIKIAKSTPFPLVVVPLLGLAMDVLLRLKNMDAVKSGIVTELRSTVLEFYTSAILQSTAAVPPHCSSALRGFIQQVVNKDDLESILAPTEKSLTRSPEISFPIVADLLKAVPGMLDVAQIRRLLTPILSASKSTSAQTRSDAINLLNILLANTEVQAIEFACTEILSLPKAGKTAGADHRITLYSMLQSIPPSASLSPTITATLPSLMSKETNELALAALASALSSHLAFQLQQGNGIDAASTAIIVKDLTNTKIPLKRAFFTTIADAIWTLSQSGSWTGAADSLVASILPALEVNLKAAAASPLTLASGPLEGYIAIAIMLATVKLSAEKKLKESISKNAIIQTISTTGAKPSFLFWEKVYVKCTQPEELWLHRSVEAAFSFMESELRKSEQLRVQIGSTIWYLAVDSQHSETRRAALASSRILTNLFPTTFNLVIRESLYVLLSRANKGTAEISQEHVSTRQRRLSSLIATCTSFDETVETAVRENLLGELLILCHHPDICETSRQLWIELIQHAKLDPLRVVSQRAEQLQALIHEYLNIRTKLEGFVKASERAMTTIVFVAPDVLLPKLLSQVAHDLDPKRLDAIGSLENGVWATPDGETFVDVLSQKKPAATVSKGKNQEIEKWEAELRQSLLAKKGAGQATLSKSDRALVDAQLAKEREIRSRLQELQVALQRGLSTIRSIVAAKVDGFLPSIASTASLLLDGSVKKGRFLVGFEAFDTYLVLSHSCSDRLDGLGTWIGVATVRSLGIDDIPEEMGTEPLNQLVARVLYRFRSLSEQLPLNAATFAYTGSLINHVISNGGVATEDEDESLEQLALALDIINFHATDFNDVAFPRMATLQSLLKVIPHQPKVAKTAISTLVGLGEAIHLNAAAEEVATIINGTLAQESYVRNACLQALQPFDLTELEWSPALWLACHDEDEQNARLTRQLWEENGLDVNDAFVSDLLAFLDHDHAYVRSSTARAFAAGAELRRESIPVIIERLRAYYVDKAKILAPEYDDYGMVISSSLDRTDPWQARLSVANSYEALAPLFPGTMVVPFFDFLITGEALGDRQLEVRTAMLIAGNRIIDLHGAGKLAALISMFENYLGSSKSSAASADQIKEAVVILFGRVAQHLDSGDDRIPKIVNRLVEALKTPSEVVQTAVSDCLIPLMRFLKTNAGDLIDQLLTQLSDAPKYAERRGAAYGLAGVIKGLGISGIKEFDIVRRLRAAMDEKKRFEARQGAMFALETLAATLGRLFEPYTIQLIPQLLTSFGDGQPDVREATQDASRVIMANLSGYGVKQILPTLLEGLDEKQWRTKKGSVELLGSMAFCAPKQLSISLPAVIPRLTGVLTDSHAQVRAAATKSLKQFGEVIHNPEIQAMVPILLKALVDPEKASPALSSLLKTSFVHYIDSPSLALVIPILERGLQNRSADTKRKASQIVGNMASLTDSKDLVPYLSRLLPLVHIVLVDPVPEARATAAKALGTLVERLGEVHFPDLVPSLLKTLKTDTSGVDRQGAAQGLSEVLSGLGMERLESLLPDIINNATSPRPYVREGFMSLLVFLPATFGTRFQPHLAKIIPPILSGLADTEEYVREAAMKAGRMIVNNYSNKAIDLLLPELERGMFDAGWRIRQSSITLIGELLFRVSGISGKAEVTEDEEEVDNVAAEQSKRKLTEVLGKEKRDSILSSLYLVRQDAVNVVRQASIHIWKALVQNTPRTVRDILPSLVRKVIELLASPGIDQRETAARTLGELCHKFGEKILGDIIPILKISSNSNDASTREGVCLALSEIMESTASSQREDQEDEIISIVRASLVDHATNVRAAAALTFDVLQETIGARAIDQTIPTLLEALRQPDESSDTALQALKEVMSVRSTTVFPVLIPTLTALPMTSFNARALASLVTVAGNALSKRLTVILNALIKALETEKDPELLQDINDAVRALLSSVSDADGLTSLMMLLANWVKHSDPTKRVAAVDFFGTFCEVTELDFAIYRPDWIRQLVSLLDDRKPEVVAAAWKALDIFVKSLDKEDMEELVVPLRRTIEATGSHGKKVPGFGIEKGIAPMIPIIISGLLNGSNEQREQAAYATGDLVRRTEEVALKPHIPTITGPLIRVGSQAVNLPPQVKSAILSSLTVMLEIIPTFVKPFFPQLTRTFIKATADTASLAVRQLAAKALGTLMALQTRVDPVVKELLEAVRTSDEAVAASEALALAYVVKASGKNITTPMRDSVVELLSDAFKENHDDHYVQAMALLFVALEPYPDLLRPIVDSQILANTPTSPLCSQILLRTVEDAPKLFYTMECIPSIVKKVVASIGTDQPSISRPAREAKELLRTLPPFVDDEEVHAAFGL